MDGWKDRWMDGHGYMVPCTYVHTQIGWKHFGGHDNLWQECACVYLCGQKSLHFKFGNIQEETKQLNQVPSNLCVWNLKM